VEEQTGAAFAAVSHGSTMFAASTSSAIWFVLRPSLTNSARTTAHSDQLSFSSMGILSLLFCFRSVFIFNFPYSDFFSIEISAQSSTSIICHFSQFSLNQVRAASQRHRGHGRIALDMPLGMSIAMHGSHGLRRTLGKRVCGKILGNNRRSRLGIGASLLTPRAMVFSLLVDSQ
jgi:hypothetical protein